MGSLEPQRKIFYLEQDPLPSSAGALETGPDHALLSERRLVLRVTAMVLRRFSQQLPPQVARVFLRRLMCVREEDGPDWHRAYALEVLRGVCLDVPLMKTIVDPRAANSSGGAGAGGSLLAEMTGLLGKVAVRACDANAPVRDDGLGFRCCVCCLRFSPRARALDLQIPFDDAFLARCASPPGGIG